MNEMKENSIFLLDDDLPFNDYSTTRHPDKPNDGMSILTSEGAFS